MIICWDASAAVKFLRDEDGTEVASGLWNLRRRSIASTLILPEVASALRRATLGPVERARADAHWDHVTDRIDLLTVSDRRAWRAAGLVATYGLRGADAVHLATALEAADLGVEVALATWDRRLHQAAAHIGIAVAPAEL